MSVGLGRIAGSEWEGPWAASASRMRCAPERDAGRSPLHSLLLENLFVDFALQFVVRSVPLKTITTKLVVC